MPANVCLDDPEAKTNLRVVEQEDGTREQLLRRAIIGCGAVLGGAAMWAVPQLTVAAPSAEQDKRVLNLVLGVEYVESGREAIKQPAFNFRGTTETERAFLKTAVALEDLAVAAYKGQAPRLRSKEVLAAAVSIHSVEARHAAWMRFLFGVQPAVDAFDDAAPKAEVQQVVAGTRFIVSRPRTKARRRPRFTG